MQKNAKKEIQVSLSENTHVNNLVQAKRKVKFMLPGLYLNKGLEIGSCPIKMVDNLSSQVDFLFTDPTKIIIWAKLIFCQKAFYSD